MGSEKIIRLEYDHHFNPTSDPRFHADHANICIGVVQIMTGKSSKVFCSPLVGDRDPVNKRIGTGSMNRGALLRNMAKIVTWSVALCSRRDTLAKSNIGEYIRRVT